MCGLMFYLFVAESWRAYPAAGKLPNATWCGEEAVGGIGGEVKWEIERGEKGKDRRVIICNPGSYQTLLVHPIAFHLQSDLFFPSEAYSHLGSGNTNTLTKTH